MHAITKLRKLAEAKGLSLIERENGHIQITGGPLLVNYYPNSKKMVAYVSGTTKGIYRVSPEKAVQMCFEVPNVPFKDKRKASYKSTRKRMFKKSNICHWCREPMAWEDCTIEHIIPLGRGGLDNANNRTLAHEKCNHERGNDMPELKVSNNESQL